MAPRTQSIIVEKIIQTTPDQVYMAFTNAGLLRRWMCEVATVAPHRGGRIYLWWNGDFYTSGEYTDLILNEKVAFTWFGRGDPGPSHITVTIANLGDGSRLTLLHTLPAGKKWQGYADSFKKEWATTLENLASVLETGKDLRFYNRPMLGILLGELNIEQAARLGVPTSEGMRLEGTLENMGAHAAGLRKDDVLVSLAGKPITSDYPSLIMALQGKKGGDTIEVIFYRGSEKKTVAMELSRRPVPDIPVDPQELARRVHQIFSEAFDSLDKVFKDVTEEQARFSPAPDEWSAKEILAHLVLIERNRIQDISNSIAGQQLWSDDFSDNDLALHAAIAGSYPSYTSMLAELRRLLEELTAFLNSFPPEIVARKSIYFNVASILLESQLHTYGHITQIENALRASRQ
jgi:uncharacterized protein YndB with AHSA1/START domain